MLAEPGPGDGTRLASGGSDNGDGDGDATTAATSSTSWLHCSVGPKMEEGETDDGLKQQVRLYLGRDCMWAKDVGGELVKHLTCHRRLYIMSSTLYLVLNCPSISCRRLS